MPKLTSDDYRQAVRKLGLKCKYNYNNKDSAMFTCYKHPDWTPSLSINFIDGIFHCFQCGFKGTIAWLVKEKAETNIYNFLGKTGNMSEFDSVYNEQPKEEVKVKRVFPLDVRGTFKPYYEHESAKAYVKRRGIDESTAMAMHFQYSKETYINGTHFIDRLVIPIYDIHNTLINVEGRALNPEDPTKCLYPRSGTKPLYEWYLLSKVNTLYLFEGIIKMAVARSDPFFVNSSASLGSMVSDYQLEQLNQFKSVILIRDMDDAGIKMAKKIKEKYHGNFNVWLLGDPSLKDVDEIPSKGITIKEFRLNGGFVPDIAYM
jgi:hypothetical protein